MSTTQITFLICGIVCLVLTVLLLVWFIYRIKHPYSIDKIENANWFVRWVRANINTILIIAMLMVLISSIAFLSMVGVSK